MDSKDELFERMQTIRKMIEYDGLFDNARNEYVADNPDDQREWDEWLEKVHNNTVTPVTYV
jgi:hypothetical protein